MMKLRSTITKRPTNVNGILSTDENCYDYGRHRIQLGMTVGISALGLASLALLLLLRAVDRHAAKGYFRRVLCMVYG
jgi:hypothetical protein